MNLGGGKRKVPKSSLTGKHRNLILRRQSLGIVQDNVRGIGTNHPIMDILGVPEARPTAQHTTKNVDYFSTLVTCSVRVQLLNLEGASDGIASNGLVNIR